MFKTAANQQPVPMNDFAERLVLGVLMSDPEALQSSAVDLSETDFGIEKHRVIFRHIAELHDNGDHVDTVTMFHALDQSGRIQSVDGISYLTSLTDGLPAVPSIDSYISILHEQARLRRLLTAVEAAKASIIQRDPSGDIVTALEKAISGSFSAPDELAEKMQTVEDIILQSGGMDAFFSPENRQGIMFPFPGLNWYTNGLHRGELTLLAARPSFGKTALALQFCALFAINQHRTRVVSLEMDNHTLVHRTICALAEVDSTRVRRGQLSAADRIRLQSVATELCGTQDDLRIADRATVTPASIRAFVQRCALRNQPLRALCVDYLQLLSGGGRFGNRTEEISYISRQLKLIAKDFRISLIALSQLTRANVRDNRRPQLQDLRDGGSLEQDADNVMFLHVKPEDMEKEVRPTELIIAKQRNGPVATLKLDFFGKYTRFTESHEQEEEAA